MGSSLIVSPFVSTLLVCLPIIFVLYKLKSSWSKETAAISSENGSVENDETQSAFTDSWENRAGQHDETQSEFTDRAFE